jgi:hypothetical protein
MFALLRNAVRADLDRQLEWAKAQAKRQVGYVGLSVILSGIASLAGLGAVIIGLVACSAKRSVCCTGRNRWRPSSACADPSRSGQHSPASPICIATAAAVGTAGGFARDFGKGRQ